MHARSSNQTANSVPMSEPEDAPMEETATTSAPERTPENKQRAVVVSDFLRAAPPGELNDVYNGGTCSAA